MDEFKIGGQVVQPGERKRLTLEAARLYDFSESGIPVEVIRGRLSGPVLFVCGAIHGDEINGVEIIKRLLGHKSLKHIRGTLIAVPIVNVFGFNTKSRYLPDRRDLNRSFPGAKDGSLASQLAHTFMREVVSKSTHGIDLHTGAVPRSNLPQVRAFIQDAETKRLALSFPVPVIINSSLRDGSLREAARERKIPMLLFEGGEALRFNEPVIRTGIRGILSVMRAIGMLPPSKPEHREKQSECFIARSSFWVRTTHSGTFVPKIHLGDRVTRDQLLGVVSDPFGEHRFEIRSSHTGINIGMTLLPLVNKGDALFHIATFEDSIAVEESVGTYREDWNGQVDTFSP